MALYTGVNAILKVPNVSSDILIKVPFYAEFVNEIEFSESKGGYPKYDYLLYFLDVQEDCGIEDYLEDTDENYNHFHQQYSAIIAEREMIVEQIDKHNLLELFQSKELSFITRNYDLANYLKDKLSSEKFYFRMISQPEQLLPILQNAKEAVGIDFESVIEEVKKLSDKYDFEVHVS